MSGRNRVSFGLKLEFFLILCVTVFIIHDPLISEVNGIKQIIVFENI